MTSAAEVYLIYEQLQAQRDQVLAPIDAGERQVLTVTERATLAALDACIAEMYPEVLAAEWALIAQARASISAHPAAWEDYPEREIVLLRDLPRGTWERAVALARELVTVRAEG